MGWKQIETLHFVISLMMNHQREILYDCTCDSCLKSNLTCYAVDGDAYTPCTLAFCKECWDKNCCTEDYEPDDFSEER